MRRDDYHQFRFIFIVFYNNSTCAICSSAHSYILSVPVPRGLEDAADPDLSDHKAHLIHTNNTNSVRFLYLYIYNERIVCMVKRTSTILTLYLLLLFIWLVKLNGLVPYYLINNY